MSYTEVVNLKTIRHQIPTRTYEVHSIKLSRSLIRNSFGDVKRVQYMITLRQEMFLQHVVELSHSVNEAERLSLRGQVKTVRDVVQMVGVISQVLVVFHPRCKNVLVSVGSLMQ